MPTNTRRPASKTSIARYVRNVGKSLALASIDTVVDNAPSMQAFLQQNDEYIKKGFSYIKNPRAAAIRADKQSTISRVYRAVGTGLKNLKDDVMSGNLYSSVRQDAEAMRMFNEDMGFDGMSEDDFNWNDGEDTDSSSRTKSISDSFDIAIEAAATAQTTAVAQGTELVIGTTKASTKLVISNIDKLNVNLSAGLSSIYSGISMTNKSIQIHVENSNKFYEATNELLREQVAMTRELLDIQRSLYTPSKVRGGNRSFKSSLSESMNSDGSINIHGYAQNIKRNIENNFGLIGLFDNVDPNDSFNPINQLILSIMDPTKMLTEEFMKAMLPKTFKNSISSLDKALSGMFSQMVAAINKKKYDGGFLGTLASIFGINIDNKTSISTKEYKKDAIPFDGITKQAIIETIPGYLARIEAALTGKSSRYYDYDEGRWINIEDISRNYKDMHKRTIANANFELRNDLDPVIRRISDKSPKAGKRFQRSVNTMMNKIYADNGYFRFDEVNGIPAWEYYGFDDERSFAEAAAAMSKDTVRGFARKNMRAKEDFANRMRGKQGAHAIERQLFNNSHEYDITGDSKTSKSGLVKGTGLLSLSYDENGKNVFHYLREILSRMRNRPKASRTESIIRRPRSRSIRSRSVSNAATSNSEDSDGDADPEDEEEYIDDSIWEAIDKERLKQASEANRANAISNFIGNALDKSPLGKFLNKFGKSFSKIMSSPIDYMTKMLNKADESLFKVMFGANPNMKDEEGRSITSIFDYIINKIRTSFDSITKTIGDGFKKHVLDKMKEFLKPAWDKYGKPIWDNVKTLTNRGFKRAKVAVNNTFGKAYRAATRPKDADGNRYDQDLFHMANNIANGGVVSADEVEAVSKSNPSTIGPDGFEYGASMFDDGIETNANGTRYVTKRGLTMISPGEMIIPASTNRRTLNKMLAGEKKDRSRIIKAFRSMNGKIGLNAKGNVNINELKQSLLKIYDENKPGASKVAAGGILGLGTGLLTGINPLLGAMAGAGISILSNSQTLQKMVFGEDVDGEHVGGIIPKKVQDYFKKAGGDAIDFGVAGGILGLVTGMGPLMGAAVGAGVGFLKNSDTVNKALFGEDGIIGPENKEKISKFLKKSAPKALIGAGIGILTGPFGLLGNAVIGAGAGLISSTNTFHELMFGKEGDEDDRGIFGAFKDGMLNPAIEKMHSILDDFKEYAKKNIFDNLKRFFDPFQQMIKNAVTNIGDSIKDHLNDMFERTMGIPIADFMREKVFKPLTKTLGFLLKIPLKIGKTVVAAPFKALGVLGDHIKTRQVQKGTAYNMTAEERLEWRKKHVLPFGRDKMKERDELLANMGEEDLSSLAAIAKGELSTREDLGKDLGRARTKTRDTISKYFNKTKNDDGRSLYDIVGVRKIEKLTKLAAEGDLTAFNKYLRNLDKKLTPEQMDELHKLVSTEITAVKSSMDAVATYDTDRKIKDKEITRILGRKFKGRKDMRSIMRLAEAELKGRHKDDPSFMDELEEENAKKEEENSQATIEFRDNIQEKIKGILDKLTTISENIQLAVNPESNTDKTDDTSTDDNSGSIKTSAREAVDEISQSDTQRSNEKSKSDDTNNEPNNDNSGSIETSAREVVDEISQPNIRKSKKKKSIIDRLRRRNKTDSSKPETDSSSYETEEEWWKQVCEVTGIEYVSPEERRKQAEANMGRWYEENKDRSFAKKLQHGDVVSADEIEDAADMSEDSIIETNAFGKRSASKKTLTMISPGETIVPPDKKNNFITKIGSGIKNLFTKSDEDKNNDVIRVPNPNTGKMMSYDSNTGEPLEDKDTTEALDELEEDKKREEAIVENTKSSSSFMSKIFGGLFGEKKDKKEKTGIFSRITSGLGSILSFFGIKGGTIAKIGLGVVGLGVGATLFGVASDWFKTSVWPTFKKALFGTTDENGDYSGGLLSGIANKYNDIMYGDGTSEHPGLVNRFNTIIHGDGSAENPGLATKIKWFIHGDGTSEHPGLAYKIKTFLLGDGTNENPGLANKIKVFLLGDGTAENKGLLGGLIGHGKNILFGENGTFAKPTGGILKWIQDGGIYKFIGEKLVPNLIGGFGLAMNYIVTPLTALIIKHFPSMLMSLGKAILNGIKIAVFKNEIERDGDTDITADTSDFGNIANATGTAIASNAGLSQEVTKIFSGNTGSSAYGTASGTIAMDINSLADTNYIAAENTYDKDGNHLNKSSTELMYKSGSGLGGLLGRKESTNTMIYDENGNIALRAYDQMNTVDSAGSKALNVVGKSFTYGLLGRGGNKVAKAMSNVSTKGGKGIFGIGKKVFGTGIKATGKTASGAHNLGSKLNAFALKSGEIASFADEIVSASGLTGKSAKAFRNEVIETVNTKGVDGIAEVIDNFGVKTGKELSESAGNKALNLVDTLSNGATKAPSKISTMINGAKSKVTDKIANSSIGKTVTKVKTSFNNSKLGSLVNRSSSIDDFAQAAVDAQGLTGRKASKAAKKITKDIKRNGAGAIDNIIGAIDDSKMTSEATENLLQKAVSATDNIAKAPTITSKAKNLLTNVAENVKTSKVGTAVGNAVDAAKTSKAGTKIAKVADGAKDLLSGIKSKIVAFFKELSENATIMKYFKKAAKSEATEKGLKSAIAGLGEKICKSAVGKAAGKALTKIASACAKFIPFVNIAMYIADFLWGYNNADTLLGVAKGDEYQIGIGQKCICGLVHLLNNNFLLGIIPTDVIIDIFVDTLFPLFGLDAASLKAARARADEILDAWNKAHPEETYTNLEDFNNKDKWTTKAKKAMTKAWDGVKEGAGKAWNTVKEGAGKAWDGIKTGATKAWDGIKTGATKAWDTVKNSKVGQAVGNAASAVTKGIGSIASDIKENGFSAIVDGAKGGYEDAAQDVKAVKSGQYTIFSKEYWTSDAKEDKENPLSTLGSVFGFITRFLQAPSAMLGWVGSKVKKLFTDMINGAKEGAMDASSDVKAVKSGQYTIFSRQYWTSDADSDNPLSKLGSIFGFVTRIFQAPSAMLGWVGSKVKKLFTDMIGGSKEGLLDASENVAAVKAGEYTIFSKDYWSSEKEESDNPLSKLGSIFGIVTRIFQAPGAMLGWVGSKVKKVFTDMVGGAKEGLLDASKDVAAVKAGEYTIFNKKYWQTDKDKDSDNPLSKLGSIFGIVTRIFQAPGAMLGWVGSKVKKVFTDMIDGVKDISKDTNNAISRAKKGEISVFGSAYWKINIDEDNPLGGVGKVIGFIQRLFNAPVILIQRAFSSITDAFADAWDWFMGLFGGNKSGSGRGRETSGKGRAGSDRSDESKDNSQQDSNTGHIYQSHESIANMRYGNSTIGDSGCAPVAATNLINNISNDKIKKTNLADAVKFAEKGGYTVNEGGTDMRYFNTYLASKGIPSINTSNKNVALDAIKSGRQVVLLGQDTYSAKSAPYGTNPHFVTATGVDNDGNIIVEDPDLPDSRVKYKPYKLMKSMISSVITGGNSRTRNIGRRATTVHRNVGRKTIGGKSRVRKGMKRVLAGRGKSLGGQAVLNVARSQIGVKEHDMDNVVKYNLAYYDIRGSGQTDFSNRSDYRSDPNNYNWAGVFVWWVFNQAGASALFCDGNKVKDCAEIANYYKRKNKYNKSNPKPGDLAIITWDPKNKKPDHIGIVESTSGNTVTTIEGDIGKCVARKTRSTDNICAYCHIDYPYEYDASTVLDLYWLGDRTDYQPIAYGGGPMTGDEYSVFVNGSPEDAALIDGTSNGNERAGETIFTKIGNLANSVFKAMYGDTAYQMMFGTTTSSSSSSSTSTGDIDENEPLKGDTNSEKIWNYLRNSGYSPEGAAGLMGNLDAESALKPTNLQDTFEGPLNHTDDSYTEAVNKKTYNKNSFINDKAGYGLAQWTWDTRKKDLYENTVEKNISIGSLGAQLKFLVDELDSKYSSLSDMLRTTTDVRSATDKVLEQYENPAVKNYEARRKLSQKWYDMYKDAGIDPDMSFSDDKIVNTDSSNVTAPIKPNTSTGTAVIPGYTRPGNSGGISPPGGTVIRPSQAANIHIGGSGRGRNNSDRVVNARTIAGPNAIRYTGGATHALNVNSAYADGGSAIPVEHSIKTETASAGVDYATFLQSIISILLQISDNTALLNTILEILSTNFNLNIDKSELSKAANSRAQAQEALNRAIKNSGGAANMANMINNRDTTYILEALRAIAKE